MAKEKVTCAETVNGIVSTIKTDADVKKAFAQYAFGAYKNSFLNKVKSSTGLDVTSYKGNNRGKASGDEVTSKDLLNIAKKYVSVFDADTQDKFIQPLQALIQMVEKKRKDAMLKKEIEDAEKHLAKLKAELKAEKENNK